MLALVARFGILFIIVAAASCRQAVPPSFAGRYFQLAGSKELALKFDEQSRPLNELDLKGDHTWSASLMMWESPMPGHWTAKGSDITLIVDDPEKTNFGTYRREANGDLTAIAGRAARLRDPITGKSHPLVWSHMPPTWETELDRRSKRENELREGENLSQSLYVLAEDQHGSLPANRADLEKLLKPYLGRKDLSKEFLYQFKGGKLPSLNKRATLVLGFLQFPDGEVQITADGGANWK